MAGKGSLWIKICEGRDLAAKDFGGTSDPYVILSMADTAGGKKRPRHRTPVIEKSLTPVWEGQEFNFVITDPENQSVSFTVYDEDLLTGDDFMGYCKLEMKGKLMNEEVMESWIPLTRRNWTDMLQGKITGELLVQAQFSSLGMMNQTILDLYRTKLVPALTAPPFQYIDAICECTTLKKDSVAGWLVSVFSTQQRIEELLQHMAKREIEATVNETNLFRTDSMATKMVSHFVKDHGHDFLKQQIAPVLQAMQESKASCEVDATKAKGGDEAVQQNIKNLTELCNNILEASTRLEKIDPAMRRLGRVMEQGVASKFPGMDKRIIHAGWFYLRYICPAIFSADTHELVKPPMTGDLRRAFILASKVLQNLANGVKFGQKEQFMLPFNDWLDSNEARIQSFFASLVDVAPHEPCAQKELDFSSRLNDLRALHRHIREKKEPFLEYVAKHDAGLTTTIETTLNELEEAADVVGDETEGTGNSVAVDGASLKCGKIVVHGHRSLGFGSLEASVAAPIIRADPLTGHENISNKDAIKGSIVVIQRGTSTFVEKANVARTLGAVGLVLVNTTDQNFTTNNPPSSIRRGLEGFPIMCIRSSMLERLPPDGTKVNMLLSGVPDSWISRVRSLLFPPPAPADSRRASESSIEKSTNEMRRQSLTANRGRFKSTAGP